jgi:hypothetical protein
MSWHSSLTSGTGFPPHLVVSSRYASFFLISTTCFSALLSCSVLLESLVFLISSCGASRSSASWTTQESISVTISCVPQCLVLHRDPLLPEASYTPPLFFLILSFPCTLLSFQCPSLFYQLEFFCFVFLLIFRPFL